MGGDFLFQILNLCCLSCNSFNGFFALEILHYIQTDGDEDLKKLSYEELKERAKDAPFEHPAVKAFYADYEFTKLLVGTEEALEGVGFTLYKDGEAWSDEVISNKNGEVKFEKISAGEYILRETRVPENMHQIAPIKFVVSIATGSFFTNNPLFCAAYKAVFICFKYGFSSLGFISF